MSHINVEVKVGRADSRCVATVEGSDTSAELVANSILSAELNKLRDSGVDLARVKTNLRVVNTKGK